jgi:hypothetical protein
MVEPAIIKQTYEEYLHNRAQLIPRCAQLRGENKIYYKDNITDELKQKNTIYYETNMEYFHNYYKNNKSDVLKQQREYYNNNKQKIKQRQSLYYYNNKEARLSYSKEYGLNNKGKIKQNNHIYYATKERYNCVCGSTVKQKNKHLQSKKHILFIERAKPPNVWP